MTVKKKNKRKKLKKVKEKHVDEIFSHYIRERDGYRCQIQLPTTYDEKGEVMSMCKVFIAPPTKDIHCSHFFSRIHRGTRFDPDNCDAFCSRCHMLVEEDKNGYYYDWKLKQLGRLRFEELKANHNGQNQFKHDYRDLRERFERMRSELKLKREGIIFGKH